MTNTNMGEITRRLHHCKKNCGLCANSLEIIRLIGDEIKRERDEVKAKQPTHCFLWFHDWGAWINGIKQVRNCKRCNREQVKPRKGYVLHD